MIRFFRSVLIHLLQMTWFLQIILDDITHRQSVLPNSSFILSVLQKMGLFSSE